MAKGRPFRNRHYKIVDFHQGSKSQWSDRVW